MRGHGKSSSRPSEILSKAPLFLSMCALQNTEAAGYQDGMILRQLGSLQNGYSENVLLRKYSNGKTRQLK